MHDSVLHRLFTHVTVITVRVHGDISRDIRRVDARTEPERCHVQAKCIQQSEK